MGDEDTEAHIDGKRSGGNNSNRTEADEMEEDENYNATIEGRRSGSNKSKRIEEAHDMEEDSDRATDLDGSLKGKAPWRRNSKRTEEVEDRAADVEVSRRGRKMGKGREGADAMEEGGDYEEASSIDGNRNGRNHSNRTEEAREIEEDEDGAAD